VWAAHTGEQAPVGPGVKAIEEAELLAGLDTPAAYRGFGAKVGEVCRDLVEHLEAARRAGRTVCAYGAPAKGVTLLNSCSITTDLLPWTVDRDPAKQGRFLPGSHLPIHPPERILAERPDEVLILVWGLAAEIMGQLPEVRGWGGHFVVAMPKLAVLG
jgi:hypothetical protein